MTNLEFELGYEEYENIIIEPSKNIDESTFKILDVNPSQLNYMKVSGTYEIKTVPEYPFYCMLMSSRHDDSLAKTIQKYLWDLNQLTNKYVLLLIFDRPENIPQNFTDYWVKRMGEETYDYLISKWTGGTNVYDILSESKTIKNKMLPCLAFMTDLKDVKANNVYVIPLPSNAKEDEIFDFLKNEIMDKLEACSVKPDPQDRLNDLKDALFPLLLKIEFDGAKDWFKKHKDIIKSILDILLKVSPAGAASGILSLGSKLIGIFTPK